MFRVPAAVRLIAAVILSAGFLVTGSRAIAQSSPTAATSTTPAIDVPIQDADGQTVGSVQVVQNEDGVTFTVLLEAGTLAEGEHGIHVHETGSCALGGDETFALAGGHFNPTDQPHGAPNSDTSHVGDLGNIVVAVDGSADAAITVTTVTLDSAGERSLLDADGSALIIHADPDDLTTDPSGNSDGRVLCAVIAADTVASPVASPAA